MYRLALLTLMIGGGDCFDAGETETVRTSRAVVTAPAIRAQLKKQPPNFNLAAALKGNFQRGDFDGVAASVRNRGIFACSGDYGVGIEEKPEVKAAYFVQVERIILNRVRTLTVEFDAFGRPTFKPGEVWWISFWERQRVTVLPTPGWISRGWWPMSQVKQIQATGGKSGLPAWLVESKTGMNVIAAELLVIDSPFGWEAKYRRVYIPIRKP